MDRYRVRMRMGYAPIWWFLGVAVLVTCGGQRTLPSGLADEPGVVDGADRPSAAYWLHLYVRDRRQTQALELATQLSQQQRISEFVPQLQFLLEQRSDAWTPLPSGGIVSARARTLSLLESQSAPVLDAYRRSLGPMAQQELTRARETGNPVDYLEVCRRYFPTRESYLAAEWLVQRWLDDGAWSLAASLALRVLESPVHAGFVSDRFIRMGILACEIAGRWEDAASIRARWSGIQVAQTFAGGPDGATGLSAGARRDDVNPGTAPSPPILAPDWRKPLESQRMYPQLSHVLAEWSAQRREQDESTAVGWVPVLSGHRLIFRDLDSIRAVHLATGETVWRYRTSTGLGNLLSPADVDGHLNRHRTALWHAAMANSLISGLATDGQRVYAVDHSEAMTQVGVFGLDSWRDQRFSRRQAAKNVLIALNLDAEDDADRLAWATGGAGADPELADHAFLGPPLPWNGLVFAMSETDRELCVTALHAPTGRVVWQQPIAEAEHSVVEDRGRSIRACTPCAAEDLILCPTHIGLLVAVDAVTGQLRWAHNSLETPPNSIPQRFRSSMQLTQRRHSAFVPTPLVVGDLVVYLPSQSDHLYALDRATGDVRWTVQNAGGEYLAGTVGDRLVVVGAKSVTAYALADGGVQWKTPLDEVVSGYGVATRDGYVIPLESGSVVNLDWETGRRRNFDFAPQTEPVGHLLATADGIVTVGAHGVALFPQSRTLLGRLMDSAPDARQPAIQLQIAEIRLVEGNLPAAVEALETAWRQLPDGDGRERVRRMLWESHFQLIRDDPDHAERYLARLDQLRSKPAERAAWLVAASAHAEARGRWQELGGQFLELAELADDEAMFECPLDQDLDVSSAVWLNILHGRLDDSLLRDQWQDQLESVARADVTSPAALVWERLAPDDVAVGHLRLALAERCRNDGEVQRAAVLLRRNRNLDDRELVHGTERALAALFADGELSLAAGQVLDRYARLAGGSALKRDVLGASPSADGAWQAWRRSRPVDWSIAQVQIQSRPRSNLHVGDAGEAGSQARSYEPYEDYQRQILAAPTQSAVEWMMRNSGRGTEIGVFDKLSSRKLFEHVLPFGANPPGGMVNVSLGLLMPFALPGELRALSPLQGNRDYVAWTLKLPEWTSRSGQAVCGPATPRFAFFQWKNVLLAVDPADGRLLWRRNDLASSSGLFADPRIGLLADDDIVFILNPDKTSYRILDAATGIVRRTGVLDQDVRFNRFDLGCTILHIADMGLERRIRVWDPATDTLLLDDKLRTRQLMHRISEDSVGWLTEEPDSRFRVYSATERKIIVDAPLTPDEIGGATSLRVFAHSGWHFLSLGRNSPIATSNHFHMPLQDKWIPGETMRDDVFAIGPEGNRVRWRRTMPQRTFLQVGDGQLPFLIAGALVRDRRDPNRRWLRFEAIDLETGVQLGAGDELPNDRLLHADYDATTGVIRLLGRKTEIELDFSRRLQWLGREDRPL